MTTGPDIDACTTDPVANSAADTAIRRANDRATRDMRAIPDKKIAARAMRSALAHHCAATVIALLTRQEKGPGVIAGAILAFAKAMGEFGATITFVSNIPGQTQTLPSAIYALLQVPGGEAQALRLVAVSLVIAFGALLISEWLAARVARRIAGAGT